MNTKDLQDYVANIHAKYPLKDAWAIYYQIRHTDDSVTQVRVARALKRIKTQPKTETKSKESKTDCFLSVQYSAKKYDD